MSKGQCFASKTVIFGSFETGIGKALENEANAQKFDAKNLIILNNRAVCTYVFNVCI